MQNDDTWRKSRRSQNDQNCVEVRNTLDQVRDSKNPGGPALRCDLTALVAAAKTDWLDH